MTTFHLSHFEINDIKHPLGSKRVLYDLIIRFLTPITRGCSLFTSLIIKNGDEKNLVVLHNRFDRQWRSLTTGNEKQIL